MKNDYNDVQTCNITIIVNVKRIDSLPCITYKILLAILVTIVFVNIIFFFKFN
jgi:hypothetical protein